MSSTAQIERTPNRWVGIWLVIVAVMVFAMVVLGGLTRLTDSGLSITQWRPVTGAIPPLNAEDWAREFELYRQSSEYALQNAGMTMGEFQFIYWWEWGHRFLGRLVGAAFLLPLIFFWLTKRLPGWLAPRLVILFLLGGLQGFIGWWMVASGLVDRVDVSQYRLAVHLGLAMALLAALVWTAADAFQGERPRLRWSGPGLLAAFFMLAVFLQIILGAFVAGLDAGRIYVDWPMMEGRFIPAAYGEMQPFWRDAFENRASVQFHHRLGGYAVALFAVVIITGALRARADADDVRRHAMMLGALTLIQVGLGVVTLMHVSPLALSITHQGVAALLLAAASLFTRRRLMTTRHQPDAARREAVPATPG